MQELNSRIANKSSQGNAPRMDHKDEINLELSRIYFGGKNDRRATPDRRKISDPGDEKDKERSSEVKKQKIFLIISVSLIVSLVIATTILLYQLFSGRTVKHNPAPLPVTAANLTARATPAPETPPPPVPMVPPLTSESGEAVLYDFEQDDDGWGIPAWALNLRDHVAVSSEHSDKYSSLGNWSLRIDSRFPDKQWSASLVEIQHFLNLKNFDIIAADIYFPETSRSKTLRGKIILTQGNNWDFTEMSRLSSFVCLKHRFIISG